jgi:hypothetical protein
MTTERIRDTLRRLSTIGLSVVACVSLVVFAAYKSDNPWLWGWSGRYVFGAILPVLGYLIAQVVLIFYPPLAGHRDRYVALCCLLSGALVFALGTWLLPSYVGPILAVNLGLLAVPVAAYRAFRTSEWLLSHIALIVVCLILVLPDVVGSVVDAQPLPARLPRWRDEFRHRWPDAEPFISPGGNLLPNLDLDVYTEDPGRPSYHMRTNSEGFRNDGEIPLVAKPGELRVLNLGDSFSNGYGVGQARFIGPLLESRWRQEFPGREVSVINAEVSDPAYGLLYLQRYGVRYAPNFVLYGYVDNDSHQAYLPIVAKRIFSIDAQGELHTHPLERAESNRRVHEAQAQFARYLYPRASLERIRLGERSSNPLMRWMDKLANDLRELCVFRWVSRLSGMSERDGQPPFISATETRDTSGHMRLVDFGSNWGMLYKKGDEMTAPLYANLFTVLESMHQTAAKHGAVFVFVYLPRREQVQARDWQRFHTFWNLDPDDFDLDREASKLRAFCDEKRIAFVDTTPAMRTAALQRNLYIANDFHFNEEGQAVATKVIFEFMKRYR